MSTLKHFTLYTHWGGANGWKVAYVIAELGLTYEPIYLDFPKKEQKAPEFLKLNPNGRIPVIVDHENDDFVLWESNAILLYLVEKYDKDHKLSASTDAQKAIQNQWLFFQASRQGPYFGQWFWFNNYSTIKISSALLRYKSETERVYGVLEAVLGKQKWLVGDKMTISDISFLPWNDLAFSTILEDYPIADKFPAVYNWQALMSSSPPIKAAIQERAAIVKVNME
ncbi:glutathione S-transferase [Calocera cornea HHB12733]|uniref:Glutathione S-transferase n=1 Tax=Calocera cornea HHB12733 TaxID=1353952 RepID=A0A165H1S0_9BASI|nr:glutathione S-transferase [Calocera cornea HHB12733]